MSNFAFLFQHGRNALFQEQSEMYVSVHFTGGDVRIKRSCTILSLGKNYQVTVCELNMSLGW